MSKSVLAIGCHPDDIEFMMAGTLFRLKENGFLLHYMNLANGCCGSTVYSYEKLITMREEESKKACEFLSARYYPSIANDIEVFYKNEIIRKVAAIIRIVQPDILIVPSIKDYMEDHMNTARIAVTAAFCRGMTNYITLPQVSSYNKDVVIYHALPYGLTDGLRCDVEPDFFVNISSVMDQKRSMLGFHKSQQNWLETSQGLNKYIETMNSMSLAVGIRSGEYKFAEGWKRHSHLGFSNEEINPLFDILKG